ALAQASVDANPGVRFLAARTLEAIGDVRQRYLKMETPPPPPPEIRKIGGLPGRTSVVTAALTAAGMNDTSASEEGDAKDPLLEGLRQALPALAARLNDPDVLVRRSAVDALETLEQEAAPA